MSYSKTKNVTVYNYYQVLRRHFVSRKFSKFYSTARLMETCLLLQYCITEREPLTLLMMSPGPVTRTYQTRMNPVRFSLFSPRGFFNFSCFNRFDCYRSGKRPPHVPRQSQLLYSCSASPQHGRRARPNLLSSHREIE